MHRSLLVRLFVLVFALGVAPLVEAGNPVVTVETSEGSIEIELYADKAPITVKNFLDYVEAKFYDGTIFHRVIPNFMIQGGGFTESMSQKKTRDAIRNEADNGLKNELGTIAMARTPAPHSATAQFFINTKDNAFLNYQGPQNFGYCVFGKVAAGLEVVKKIEQVKTTTKPPHANVPVTPVVIKSVRVKDAAKGE